MDRLDKTRITNGALAGLAGGVIFGILMTMMGMIGMVGALAGQPGNVAVGWIVHLIISAVIGIGFGVIAPERGSTGLLAGWGAVYGAVWWFLGPLMIMPIAMGMGPQLSAAGMQGALPSLWGHLAFGVVAGLAYALLGRAAVTSVATA